MRTSAIAVNIGTDPHSAKAHRVMVAGLAEDCEVRSAASFAELDEVVGNQPLGLITIFSEPAGIGTDHPLNDFLADKRYQFTRIVLLAADQELTGLDQLANSGRLDTLCFVPGMHETTFLQAMRDQLNRFKLLTGDTTAQLAEKFALNLDLTDSQIVEQIVRSADQYLGYQPRVKHPPGVCLTIEGQRVEEICLALSGQVMLERASDAGDITMHHASTGRIIGLLALTSGRRAFFTARTTTDVVVVQLTFEELNYILERDQRVATLLASLFVRSFDRRLRRAEDIQKEQFELAAELEQERRNLREALSNLQAARQELMSQARFASLGELAAGVAHELNNPMAAIQRTAEYLQEDIENLIKTSRDQKWARRTHVALNSAANTPAVTTKQARQIRKELEQVTNDRNLAQRLVLAGIHNPEFAAEIAKSSHITFETIENAGAIGTGLRNLRTASTRITELVTSLRSYARPDGDPITDVDIHQGLEDTIRLVSHKLRGIEMHRNYRELPMITCNPGQLAQVWTNLITNAAEAMAGAAPDGATEIGNIQITTANPKPGWVRVKITDNGPGMDPNTIEHLFEPRFTTKNGQVRFGMGIGLGVCRSIVQKHHGILELESSPEGTTAIVTLPVDGPRHGKEEE
ncbi:MAG: ATP-binding protein [Trueperella sp.]|nr:ATP-binding protein [Trueperella sp.]